ncbi:MAG: hypothetical protein MUC71_04245 [Steroidobacteraceae bacterium]|jgi:hypothetical protein|nr:hypothetical protein [Steroidobacteraceae bacterium]
MNRLLTWSLTVALCASAVAGCGRSEPKPAATEPAADDSTLTISIKVGSLGLSRDSVRIRPEGLPEARIFPGGRLVIDGSEVEVTDAERADLIAYHAAAMQLGVHAKDTGIAGAKVGLAAVGAVISGLAKGDPDSIGPKVEAEAEKVKQAARLVCEDIAAMRKAQDALAAELEAFRPYATLEEADELECRSGVDSGGAPGAGDAPPAKEVAPAAEEPVLI